MSDKNVRDRKYARVSLRRGVVVVFVVVALFLIAGSRLRANDQSARWVWHTLGIGQLALALALDQHDARLAVEIGNFYFGQGSYDTGTALAAYRRAVAIDPGIRAARYQIARILFVRADFYAARTELLIEMTLHPDNHRAWYMLGLIDAYQKRYTDAERDFKTFTSFFPEEWAGHNDLAWVLSLDGKYTEVLSELGRASILVPGADVNPWYWNLRGVAQLNLGFYEDARTSFQKASSLANALTLEDWHKAYPGNDIASGAQDLRTFQEAIKSNIAKAQSFADQR